MVIYICKLIYNFLKYIFFTDFVIDFDLLSFILLFLNLAS